MNEKQILINAEKTLDFLNKTNLFISDKTLHKINVVLAALDFLLQKNMDDSTSQLYLDEIVKKVDLYYKDSIGHDSDEDEVNSPDVRDYLKLKKNLLTSEEKKAQSDIGLLKMELSKIITSFKDLKNAGLSPAEYEASPTLRALR